MMQTQEIHIIDLATLVQRGFRSKTEVHSSLRYHPHLKAYPVFVTLHRASDRGVIAIRYEETDRRDRMVGKPRTNAILSDTTPPTPSGLPLGVDQYRRVEGTMSYQYVATGYGYLGINYGDSGGISSRGSFEAREQDWSDWNPWVENLARSIVSKAVFRRLDADAPGRIGSADVPAFRCRLSETRFLKLREWATARNYAIRPEENAVRLTRNGTEILIPLGSDRVRVGATWVRLPDLVAERNGSWYVPEEIDRVAR